MCYMKSIVTPRVGVRELRQNLSVHLARVISGETLEVTDRGVPVAILAPLVAGESMLHRLSREGSLVRGEGDVLAVRGRHRAESARRSSRELQRERDDRRL